MTFWQTLIVGVLFSVPTTSATLVVVWWFTFRTIGWPFNWRVCYAPAYWRWVARTFWPGRHEAIELPMGRMVCVCGRWRCPEVRPAP
jgi:hypothetical protein